MTILIDIGHPDHVHYFRNTIKNLESKGHTIIITARDKGVIRYLLDFYNLPYINIGVGKNSRVGELLYMIKADAQFFIGSILQLFGYIQSRWILRYQPFPKYIKTQLNKEQKMKFKI